MKWLLILLTLFPLDALAQQQPTPQPAPVVTITANEGETVSLYQGWPLIVSVTITNSLQDQPGSTTSLVVSPPQGAAWTTAVQFSITSSSGSTVQWPLTLVGSPSDPALTLDPTDYVTASWQMSMTNTSSLPPDTYQLAAVLQVSNSSGWNGAVQSNPITVQIAPEPALTQNQQQEKTLFIAEYQTNAGDLDGALTTVQQYLNSNPNDPLALEAAANLLELQGYPGLAFFEANAAVNAFYQADPTPLEAPWNVLAMQQRLLTYMTTPAGVSAGSTTTITSGASIGYSSASQSVTLTASVSSPAAVVNEGTVTFSIAGIANPVSVTVLQGTATTTFTIPGGTPAGSYALQASYAGTSDFLASNNSSQLTITPIPLSIVANNLSSQYGQPIPAFSASYTGFVNGDTPSVLSGTLTCATTATASSPAGTYPIGCAGLTSSNYAISYVPGVLTITTAPLTITASNATRAYGQANPAFTVLYSGFVNSDSPASLAGTLTCATAATQSSPAGMYPINCSGLSSSNYTITYVPGTLTITAPVCAADVSGSVSITRSGYVFNFGTQRFSQTLTLTNSSATTISGPVSVVLDNLSTNATLYGPSGQTSCTSPQGSVYMNASVSNLTPGASTSVVLQFIDPTKSTPTYSTRVLAGNGSR